MPGAEDDLDAVHCYLEALNDRDLDRLMEVCAEDFQLRPLQAPIEGPYAGRAGLERFLADMGTVSAAFTLQADRLEAAGPGLIVGHLRMIGRGRTIDQAVEVPVPTVYELAQGRIRLARVFRDRPEALLCAAELSGSLDALRTGYELANRGDLEGLVPLLDPGFEFVPQRDATATGVEAARDREAFLTVVMAARAEVFTEVVMRPEHFLALDGGRVLVLGAQTARSASAGVGVEATLNHLWTLRAGVAVRLQVFASPAEARGAAGLEG